METKMDKMLSKTQRWQQERETVRAIWCEQLTSLV